MADANVKLRLKFKDNKDKDTEMSYSYAKKDVAGSDVKALMNAITQNKAAFKNGPTTAVSAAIVETTETPVNLSA